MILEISLLLGKFIEISNFMITSLCKIVVTFQPNIQEFELVEQ